MTKTCSSLRIELNKENILCNEVFIVIFYFTFNFYLKFYAVEYITTQSCGNIMQIFSFVHQDVKLCCAISK